MVVGTAMVMTAVEVTAVVMAVVVTAVVVVVVVRVMVVVVAIIMVMVVVVVLIWWWWWFGDDDGDAGCRRASSARCAPSAATRPRCARRAKKHSRCALSLSSPRSRSHFPSHPLCRARCSYTLPSHFVGLHSQVPAARTLAHTLTHQVPSCALALAHFRLVMSARPFHAHFGIRRSLSSLMRT
eukprot:706327-Pleurochrysis_carterae.AAC.1